MRVDLTFPALFAVLFFSSVTYAEVSVRYSCCETRNNQFVGELLSSALKASSPEVNFSMVKCYPHLRKRLMLEHGTIDVLPLIQSKKYDEELIPINVPLTKGYISKRVLVVSKSKVGLFDNVNSLEDFRSLNLVGAFGQKWFDNRVWEENDLKHVSVADWQLIYCMLSRTNRNVDYFPRSVLEAQEEIRTYSDLVIVPNILFSYDKNVIIYISPKRRELKPILEKALRNAQSSGLIDKLVDKYYGQDLNRLEIDKRKVFQLKTPE
jgi:hypothetical protein